MSAPTKEGLDYFPFDVDLLDNDDLDFLREQYGVVINDIYIALLTLLYRKKGYYIPYETKQERKDCVWYIFKRVRGGKYSVKQEAIPEMIEALVAQGLFSGSHYPKIITSERAQKTYYSATVERKPESFNIISEYWVLDDATMRKLSKRHPYYLFLHPETNSDEEPSKSDDYRSKSTEKPLNKSKVNISSNEDIEISKKESNKEKKNQSYDELFENMGVKPIVKEALIEFIRHLQANGTVLINSRLEDIIVGLDMRFRFDELGKVKYIRDAISKGYKRLPFEGEG